MRYNAMTVSSQSGVGAPLIFAVRRGIYERLVSYLTISVRLPGGFAATTVKRGETTQTPWYGRETSTRQRNETTLQYSRTHKRRGNVEWAGVCSLFEFELPRQE